MLNEKQLRDLIKTPEESFRIEKTVSTKDSTKFGEAICSFANDLPDEEKAGYLLVGVDDSGRIVGLDLDEAIEQNLLDFSKDGRIIPSPSIYTKIFHLPEGDVCVAEVLPSTLPPVRFKGKICIRKGPRKDFASEQEEKILIEKRNRFGATFDIQPCLQASKADLDLNAFLLSYLPLAIDQETLEANNREIELQLSSLQFWHSKKNCPTNAGILLFGINPTFYVPGASVQYVKFDGTNLYDNDIAEKNFQGDFLTQLGQLKSFIQTNIIKRHLPNLGEEYRSNYPREALEELVFNAVIHNDYSVNAPIKFYEFQDRVEVTNNGGLYGNAKNDFPGNNDYRNPVIATAAKVLGYVNRFGVGIQRAKRALQLNGNPAPKFLIDQTGKFTVIIPKK